MTKPRGPSTCFITPYRRYINSCGPDTKAYLHFPLLFIDSWTNVIYAAYWQKYPGIFGMIPAPEEFNYYIDGLVQDCSISSALAMEILQSCTKPSI